jgi:hypothetical protein
MSPDYYSDEIYEPRKPTIEEIQDNVWKGIHAVIMKWYLEKSFIGYGNNGIFENLLSAEIEGLSWPTGTSKKPETIKILDLIQFCYKNIVSPTKDYYHLFETYGNNSRTERLIGQKAFKDEINLILKRNGVIYQLNENGSISRLIPDEFIGCVRRSIFNSGDAALDELLNLAREKFLDSKPDVRKDALEKLWDAWERLKTLENHDKNKSMSITLEEVSSEINFRKRLDAESKELSEIGNKFRIRHHETDKIPLESSNHVDYLFYRMFSLIYLILKSTNRIK